MATKYHGKNATIAIGTGSPLTTVCAFAEWTAGFPRQMVNVSTFCDANDVQLPGNKQPAGSFTGFFTKEDMQTIYEAGDADTSTTLRITPSSLEPGVYFEGPAWLTVDSIGGTYAGAVTLSVSWVADGDWTAAWGFTSP
jgi:hypothetical protein